MKHRISIAIGLLMVGASCQQRKPVVSDADFEEFRVSNPGMTKQCLDDYRYKGLAAWRPDDPDCFAMTRPQRWSGLWNTGWEWTNFCPEPAKACPGSAEHGDIWLQSNEKSPEEINADGVYRVDFVGRRTKVPGYFGHLGQYDHLMVVDRWISVRTVPGERYTKR